MVPGRLSAAIYVHFWVGVSVGMGAEGMGVGVIVGVIVGVGVDVGVGVGADVGCSLWATCTLHARFRQRVWCMDVFGDRARMTHLQALL